MSLKSWRPLNPRAQITQQPRQQLAPPLSSRLTRIQATCCCCRRRCCLQLAAAAAAAAANRVQAAVRVKQEWIHIETSLAARPTGRPQRAAGHSLRFKVAGHRAIGLHRSRWRLHAKLMRRSASPSASTGRLAGWLAGRPASCKLPLPSGPSADHRARSLAAP